MHTYVYTYIYIYIYDITASTVSAAPTSFRPARPASGTAASEPAPPASQATAALHARVQDRGGGGMNLTFGSGA